MTNTLYNLINIQYIKYNIQYKKFFYKKPLQYYSNNNIYLYYNLNLYQNQTPPNQYQPLYKNLQLINFKNKLYYHILKKLHLNIIFITLK